MRRRTDEVKMRLIPAAILSMSALSLWGCASTTPRPTACNTAYDAELLATQPLLQKAYPDPKGHHWLVSARSKDAQGNLVVEASVWPLSGPQEPEPGRKVRMVIAACTMKPLAVAKLPA
jgi:hypothetical protein